MADPADLSRDPAPTEPAPARILAEEPVYSGFATLTRVTFEVPWKGETRRIVREIEHHGHGASVLPVDPARKVGVLLRQFRMPPVMDGRSGWLWEVPAGLLEGDAPEICAAKEAEEEAGLAMRSLESLGDLLSSPGIIRECVHMFWGTYAGPPPAATGGLDHEGEMIEVHEMPMADIARMAEDGEILDAKSAVSVLRLKARRPDLFEA